MRTKVLFVDDNPNILSALKRNFRNDYEVDTAERGEDGLDLLASHGPYAVVVADMKMPGMDGIEFLERAERSSPDTVRVMLTGNADQQTAVDAVNRGRVFRFLNKPIKAEAIKSVLDDACRFHEIEQKRMRGVVEDCLQALSELLGVISPFAAGRGQVLRYSVPRFAGAAGAESVWPIEMAALMGLLGVSSLPDALSRNYHEGDGICGVERKLLASVPVFGHDLLATIPYLGSVANIVKYLNKDYSGEGVPDDPARGSSIPLGSRLLRILNDRLDLEADGVVKEKAKELMLGRLGVYDTDLLSLSFEVFPDYLGSALSRDKQAQAVELRALKPGQVLVSDLRSKKGDALVDAGRRLSRATLQRIRNHLLMDQASGSAYVQEG